MHKKWDFILKQRCFRGNKMIKAISNLKIRINLMVKIISMHKNLTLPTK